MTVWNRLTLETALNVNIAFPDTSSVVSDRSASERRSECPFLLKDVLASCRGPLDFSSLIMQRLQPLPLLVWTLISLLTTRPRPELGDNFLHRCSKCRTFSQKKTPFFCFDFYSRIFCFCHPMEKSLNRVINTNNALVGWLVGF